jgi:CubicO group peptidase (beta-lactamase class C family)
MSGFRTEGDVEAGFGAVADAFATNFAAHGEIGAAVSVVSDGQTLVDLWGGWADAAGTRPWRSDTIVTCFSTTKGVTATCACLLIDRGLLDPDAPIASYWPEFAASGKSEIPVRWAMSHSAGLAAVAGDLTIEDVTGWDGVVSAIAAQPPEWEPGTKHGYHVRSYGWIVGELIRRISGRMPGDFFRDEIGDPNDLSFWIGLPPEQDHRVADLVPDPKALNLADLLDADSLMRRAALGPSELFAHGYDETWNQEHLRRAQMPSSNGVGDARSLARLYALVIGAGPERRLLSEATIATATEMQSSGVDYVLGVELTFGLGYSLPPTLPPAVGPGSFGHGGAGGSMAFADPDASLGFGYVMNQLRFDLDGDPRALGLAEAVYSCLG